MNSHRPPSYPVPHFFSISIARLCDGLRTKILCAHRLASRQFSFFVSSMMAVLIMASVAPGCIFKLLLYASRASSYSPIFPYKFPKLKNASAFVGLYVTSRLRNCSFLAESSSYRANFSFTKGNNGSSLYASRKQSNGDTTPSLRRLASNAFP